MYWYIQKQDSEWAGDLMPQDETKAALYQNLFTRLIIHIFPRSLSFLKLRVLMYISSQKNGKAKAIY
jgi:hypothetical protein